MHDRDRLERRGKLVVLKYPVLKVRGSVLGSSTSSEGTPGFYVDAGECCSEAEVSLAMIVPQGFFVTSCRGHGGRVEN